MIAFNEFRDKALEPKFQKMKGDRLYRLEREFSVRISWVLYRFFPFLKGNHITLISLFSLLLVVVLAVYIVIGDVSKTVPLTIISLMVLYSVTITDKIDGELARVLDFRTQKGVYFDHAVHVLYPLIFYFLLASYFLTLKEDFVFFSLTLLTGVFTQMLIGQRESRLLIGEKLRTDKYDYKDLRVAMIPRQVRPFFLWRIVDYLTFMIYAWTLFFYIGLVVLSIFHPIMAYNLYFIHIVLTIVISGYKVFLSYPRYGLYTKEELARKINQ